LNLRALWSDRPAGSIAMRILVCRPTFANTTIPPAKTTGPIRVRSSGKESLGPDADPS
jgi:hypothetical protein